MALSQDEILYAKSRKAEMPDISSDMLMGEIDQLRSSIEGTADETTVTPTPVTPQGVTTVDAVEAEQPMTRGQEMLSEFKTGLETVGDASFGERAKLAAKGIVGAVARTFEKTAEGFGDLGSLIGLAISGVDLNDEQKAQIFDDLEVQKKTQE